MEITSLKLSQDKESILLELNDAANVIQLHVWNQKNYKVQELRIDLSDKLNGSTSQYITITPQDLEVDFFDGVYFVETIDLNSNTTCKIVGALTRYEECVIKEILNTQECDDCPEEIYMRALNIDMMLHALILSIKHNLTQEVLTAIYGLDKYCGDECNSCGSYKKA